MTAPDRETPSTSWAVWAWQAYRDGRLVEASETHTPLADAHPLASEALAAPTDAQVASACLSYRHDFGLLDAKERALLMFQAREWLHAWRKELPAHRAIGERAE